MTRYVTVNDSTAEHRRAYFHLVGTNGITPATGEADGQPQISVNGAAWTNTGIATLPHIGNGRYYADLDQSVIDTAGTVIETRYKSANTAECPGDTFQVVAFDPHDAAALGLSKFAAIEADTQDLQTQVGVAGAGLTAIGDARLKLLEADQVIDTGSDPWQLVWIEKGTGGLGVGVELLRKDIKDTDGNPVTSTTVVPGQTVTPS